jgi:hypothetical protein
MDRKSNSTSFGALYSRQLSQATAKIDGAIAMKVKNKNSRIPTRSEQQFIVHPFQVEKLIWYEPLAEEAAMLVFLNDSEKVFDRSNFGIGLVAVPL